jgi:ABC-type phosphate transport system auxiliary subunit
MSTIENIREEALHLAETLRTQRDELKVQMNLANKEAHEEWGELEKKWEQLQSKLKQLKAELNHSGHDVGDAISLLGDEIKVGYQRLRKLF